MKNIIVMSGDIGSGKSSVAKALQEKTGYEVIGTGIIQRAIARRRGLTTLELNQISQQDRSIDDEIDSYVVETGKTRNDLIIDSRLAWHFIPDAFKVFLAVDPMIGAERVFHASRTDENNASLDDTLRNNLQRQTFEDERFQKLYQVNFRDYGNYDLIIDTSYTVPEDTATKIYSCFRQWHTGTAFPCLWINPKKLVPTPTALAASSVQPGSVTAISEQPIKVFAHQGFIFLISGAEQVIAAHQAGLNLIPAVNLSPAGLQQECSLTPEALLQQIAKADLIAWEDRLGFKFTRYPE